MDRRDDGFDSDSCLCAGQHLRLIAQLRSCMLIGFGAFISPQAGPEHGLLKESMARHGEEIN